MDNSELVERILSQQTGKQLEIIPIPQEAWQELREEYLSKQEHASNEEGEPSGPSQPEAPDPFIEEARKLAGDDLLEIHDE